MISLLVFDPGGTTGFAALDERGEALYTTALLFDQLEGFLELLATSDVECVIEQGPQWGHHSPVTKRAEAVCRDAFPDATFIPPNRWKSHPASRKNGDRRRYATQHERDAVMLGRWFQSQERDSVPNTTGEDSEGT